jgi:hypothetical protein
VSWAVPGEEGNFRTGGQRADGDWRGWMAPRLKAQESG